jgi:hypothetical protein
MKKDLLKCYVGRPRWSMGMLEDETSEIQRILRRQETYSTGNRNSIISLTDISVNSRRDENTKATFMMETLHNQK